MKAQKAGEEELGRAIRKAMDLGRYVILPHARQRCRERQVDDLDIQFVLEHGRRVKARDKYDSFLDAWSYCLEGQTLDERSLRVIIALLEHLVVVTVVVLEEKK